MHRQQHPDTEQLDQLRAGLLDDQLDVKAALERHIESCPNCQSLINSWQQLGPDALGSQLNPGALERCLQQARQQTLNTPNTRRPRTFMPYATAALVLVALSAGFWMAQPEYQKANMVAANTSQDVPGLYEDIDFYLWLAEQNGNSIHREENDPNST